MGHPLLCLVCQLGKLFHHVSHGEAPICFCEPLDQVERGPFPPPSSGKLPEIARVNFCRFGQGLALRRAQNRVEFSELHAQILTAR